jgi:hypothetical protein
MKLFRREKQPVKCFTQEYRHENLSSPIDRGVKPVELDKIVGSVGRQLANSQYNRKNNEYCF